MELPHGADPDTPKTMRIDYRITFDTYKSEWVCPEHTGYARGKFEKWWRERAAFGCPIPKTAKEAVSLAEEGLLAAPETITVKTVAGERFERITAYKLKERPMLRETDEELIEEYHSNTPSDLGVVSVEDEIPF